MSHNTSGIQTPGSDRHRQRPPQLVKIDTHGTGGGGSYISVSTPHVMVTQLVVHGLLDVARNQPLHQDSAMTRWGG